MLILSDFYTPLYITKLYKLKTKLILSLCPLIELLISNILNLKSNNRKVSKTLCLIKISIRLLTILDVLLKFFTKKI